MAYIPTDQTKPDHSIKINHKFNPWRHSKPSKKTPKQHYRPDEYGLGYVAPPKPEIKAGKQYSLMPAWILNKLTGKGGL